MAPLALCSQFPGELIKRRGPKGSRSTFMGDWRGPPWRGPPFFLVHNARRNTQTLQKRDLASLFVFFFLTENQLYWPFIVVMFCMQPYQSPKLDPAIQQSGPPATSKSCAQHSEDQGRPRHRGGASLEVSEALRPSNPAPDPSGSYPGLLKALLACGLMKPWACNSIVTARVN